MATNLSVRVSLRIRPFTPKELLGNATSCITPLPPPTNTQIIMGADRTFTFDTVHGMDATQKEVFEDMKENLDGFIQGRNEAVLAYGQTGSGKTYTMGTGFDEYDTASMGLVYRSVEYLFNELNAREPSCYSYTMSVSFLELYNEELVDLLNPATRTLKKRNGLGGALSIREDGKGGVVWDGVQEEVVKNADELMGCLKKGSLCRTTASTDMNASSSRSHAIFSIILRQTVPEDPTNPSLSQSMNLSSKLNFVDLAGSERLKRTNATGDRAKEGISINSGLLALGNVISALGDESKRTKNMHIPYRDSKLTRLLQDSLGGNSQTLMMACVSPADSNFMETLNTLKYANRARNIKNKVTVNQDFGAMEVASMRSEVRRLRLEIATLRSGAVGSDPVMSMPGTPMRASTYVDPNRKISTENAVLLAELNKLNHLVDHQASQIKTFASDIVRLEAEKDIAKLVSGTQEQEGMVREYRQEIMRLQLKLDHALFANAEMGMQSVRDRKENKDLIPRNAYSLDNLRLTSKLSKSSSLSKLDHEGQLTSTLAQAKSEISSDMEKLDELRRKMAEDGDDSSPDGDIEPLPAASFANNDEIAEIQDQIGRKQNIINALEKSEEEYTTMLSNVKYEQDLMMKRHDEKLAQLTARLSETEMVREHLAAKEHKKNATAAETQSRKEADERIRTLKIELTNTKREAEGIKKRFLPKIQAQETLIGKLKGDLEKARADRARIQKRIREKENAVRDITLQKELQYAKLLKKERQTEDLKKEMEQKEKNHRALLKRTQVDFNSRVKSLIQKASPTKRPKSSARSVSSSNFRPFTSPGKFLSRPTTKTKRKLTEEEEGLEEEEDRDIDTFTQRKTELDECIQTCVEAKQTDFTLEELVSKRDILVEQKMTLMAEREEVLLEGSEADANILASIVDKLEIVEAEIRWMNARLRTLQSDSSNGSIADWNTSYTSAIENLFSLSKKEGKEMLTHLFEELLGVKAKHAADLSYKHEMEVEMANLRRTLHVVQNTAVVAQVQTETKASDSRRDVSRKLQQIIRETEKRVDMHEADTWSSKEVKELLSEMTGVGIRLDAENGAPVTPTKSSAKKSRSTDQLDELEGLHSRIDSIWLKTRKSIPEPPEEDSAQRRLPSRGSKTDVRASPTEDIPRALSSNVFERLANTHTQASQAKIFGSKTSLFDETSHMVKLPEEKHTPDAFARHEPTPFYTPPSESNNIEANAERNPPEKYVLRDPMLLFGKKSKNDIT